MNERKAISKKIRFEVFKRDNFTCQYCGRKAPDVILEVDHIKPVSSGGEDSILNYITSCFDCNRGKGKTLISDQAVLEKQRKQLEMLNEKREQMEMMLSWKKELDNFENEQVERVEDYITSITGYTLKFAGKSIIKKAIKQFGFEEVYTVCELSFNQYYKDTIETTEKAIEYIPKICYYRKKGLDKSERTYHINYLLKIAKNSFRYIDTPRLRKYLISNFKDEEFEQLKDIFIKANNWSKLRETLEEFYGGKEL